MNYRRTLPTAFAIAALSTFAATAAGPLQTPEQFLGYRVGADNKMIRWDKIVEYMKLAAASSDRVHYRELGKTSDGNPFVVMEISASETLKNLDKYKAMERQLYFQNGTPTDAERDAIFRQGKVVVAITCSIHATEIGATQMAVELVHKLATDDSPQVKKILDNVIFVLVPSLNPDGEIMVTDWFNKNVGTPFEPSPIPYLYHPYVGHDNNRDMYMFTQKESQQTAQLLWHDWFPSVWLDEHQQGSNGPRMFTMPATDPINPNVHPLIYRWNGILGQSQAAALEAAGKDGIIYNATYTNFWEGAMAWSGWWHNEVGLLTEAASARIAAPMDQHRAVPGRPAPGGGGGGEGRGRGQQFTNAPLPPPTDITPRTEYPRPWMGGHWTLRDIVDYDMIATMALLETTADRRGTILQNIYEVNRATIEHGKTDVTAILVPMDGQQDPREAAHLVDRLQLAGVQISRADQAFDHDGKHYGAGTFVIPMTQVFARYAKDMLEKQTYPEVRRAPNAPPEAPYDVTAWSLGMLLGVKTAFVNTPLAESVKLTLVPDAYAKSGENASGMAPLPLIPKGVVTGNGTRFTFDYKGPDTALAINRLFKDGAHVAFDGPSRVAVTGIARASVETAARDFGLSVKASAPEARTNGADRRTQSRQPINFRAPRIGMYQPWTGGNMDEGWTRWVLEQYGFTNTPIHNADIRAGKLRQKFDAIILADQEPRSIIDGYDAPAIRPEYRGGIGQAGVDNLKQFVADGGTLIAMGNACDLAIEQLPIPVRDIKKGLTRDQHFAPGAILRLEVDTQNPNGYGVAADTFGFYINSPFFELTEGFNSQRASVVARYPNTNVIASGWLKGEELMAGRAAVVSIDMNPGTVVLFGLRPQHRAQTHATFPLLFNALYLSAQGDAAAAPRKASH
ncbi:MAG TPA: M14 metallopeptidase family protein [Vicinamibacterales bacterium]|nr:M14 metallopeptidase family protein [Vicinamibacterales bacterium]